MPPKMHTARVSKNSRLLIDVVSGKDALKFSHFSFINNSFLPPFHSAPCFIKAATLAEHALPRSGAGYLQQRTKRFANHPYVEQKPHALPCNAWGIISVRLIQYYFMLLCKRCKGKNYLSKVLHGIKDLYSKRVHLRHPNKNSAIFIDIFLHFFCSDDLDKRMDIFFHPDR